MEDEAALRRQGHRLLRVGATLFLLALFVGISIPAFTVPRLGLATHLLGITQGTFLLVLGLVWPRLALAPAKARLGHGLAVYGCLAPWTANLLAAVWGAGSSMLPMAAGAARGSNLQETVIRVLLISGALSLVSAMVLVVWGLRRGPKA
jgi:hydroxylaminobenzene mutase